MALFEKNKVSSIIEKQKETIEKIKDSAIDKIETSERICEVCEGKISILDSCYTLEFYDEEYGEINLKKVCYDCNHNVLKAQQLIEKGINNDVEYETYKKIKSRLERVIEINTSFIVKNAFQSMINDLNKYADAYEEHCKQGEFLKNEDVLVKREALKAKGYLKGYEYKVISVVDSHSGKCDTFALENKLNNLALEGWRVKGIVGNELGKNALAIMGAGVNSTVEELIVILEREYNII